VKGGGSKLKKKRRQHGNLENVVEVIIMSRGGRVDIGGDRLKSSISRSGLLRD